MKKVVIVLSALVLSLLLAQFVWADGGVLLVDDDCNAPDVRAYYEDALEWAGFHEVALAETADQRAEYQIYNIAGPLDSGPNAAFMAQFEAVIWFTGATCCVDSNCITGIDEGELATYLDGGGKLILFAQDYFSEYGDVSFSAGQFPYDYLKVGSVETDVWQGIEHTAMGNTTVEAITYGYEFELCNPFETKGGDLYMDKIQPLPSVPLKEDPFVCTGEFTFDDTSGTGFASLSWKVSEAKGYPGPRVFFSTVCLAALMDESIKGNTKGELTYDIMEWILGDYADYGDAPDPPYYSRYENYGAYHTNSDGVFEWLGEHCDLEYNSRQVDMDNYDDGIVFHKPYVPGEMGSVDVTITVSDWTSKRYNAGGPPPYGTGWNDSLYVHAWFDWNQDDDWDDAGENIICTFICNPWDEAWGGNNHQYNITFPVPAWATNDDMWTRFRLQYHYYDNIYYGEHFYGEVEDYVLGHPLSVGLSTFYASAGDRQATLFWTTQSEINNLGFYLMRSENGSEYVRVNEDLIPGQGTSEARHDYSYLDKDLVNGVTYSYKVVDVDLAGTQAAHGPITVTPQAVAQVPTEYALSQNYPNPFNAQTAISYAIPIDSHVSLKVFNILGEEVRALVDADQKASTYQVTWDGKDVDGRMVASGVYFCTLKAGQFSQTNKMVFMK